VQAFVYVLPTLFIKNMQVDVCKLNLIYWTYFKCCYPCLCYHCTSELW